VAAASPAWLPVLTPLGSISLSEYQAQIEHRPPHATVGIDQSFALLSPSAGPRSEAQSLRGRQASPADWQHRHAGCCSVARHCHSPLSLTDSQEYRSPGVRRSSPDGGPERHAGYGRPSPPAALSSTATETGRLQPGIEPSSSRVSLSTPCSRSGQAGQA